MAAVASSRRANDIFASVFPKPNFTTPTPEATPNIGSLPSPAQAFGGFNAPNSFDDGATQYHRAWSTVTRFLAVPVSPDFDNSTGRADDTVLAAFSHLLQSPTSLKDLVSWFSNEIGVHFRNIILPELKAWQQPIPVSEAGNVIHNTIGLLQQAQHHYFSHLDQLLFSGTHGSVSAQINALRTQVTRNLHTLVLHSLPRQRPQRTLAAVMYQYMVSSLDQSESLEPHEDHTLQVQSTKLDCPFRFLACRRQFDDLEEWYPHWLSHFTGGVPTYVDCPFRNCTWWKSEPQEGPDGLAWREVIEHIASQHQGGKVDTSRRPDKDFLSFLLRTGAIDRAQRDELELHGRLADVQILAESGDIPKDDSRSSTFSSHLIQPETLGAIDFSGLPLKELYSVGLGGLTGERAFAHAVHAFLQGPAIERRYFQVDWNGHSSVVAKLRSWVKDSLSPSIEQALAALTGNSSLKLSSNDIHQFTSMAVSNLGRLRTTSLFDYITSWPASTGAILDIWEYLSAGNQADKAHVCQSFSNQIQRRLLHAGASTTEILSIYVNVIHAFKSLDSRGVLLEKVAVPIRSYLRAREDTVSIIAASFLADVDSHDRITSADADKVCADITIEVAKFSSLEPEDSTGGLNWHDMEWTPDPIDAGPDYKSSKSSDVVAYILALFEQEEFIKEITNVLAQHLLQSTDSEYVKETRTIELFKSRLDDSKLQAAEVMLKDMRHSVALNKRINPLPLPGLKEIQAAIPEEGITAANLVKKFKPEIPKSDNDRFMAMVKLTATQGRDKLFYAKKTRLPPDPRATFSASRDEEVVEFKAQILSSFFWPDLRSNEFDMPSALDEMSSGFEQKFALLGNQRKLHFRPALARVSMRLELEDRTVEELDVPGWRASVIDAFTSKDGSSGLSAQQVTEKLNMEEELVHDALHFWTSKRVLYIPLSRSNNDEKIYAILERLDMDTAPASWEPIHHPEDDIISAIKSQDDMLRESAPMFSTFIANMLRNQGPKQVGGMMGITSLLKMVLPSFTYGDEEVNWLLGEMEREGVVTREGVGGGEIWRVVS